MAKHYKIKLEDKAALLNRLRKLKVNVDSFQIKDNKLDNAFEFDVNDPQAIKITDTVLKDSPKITTVKEQLKIMVQEELKNIRNRG